MEIWPDCLLPCESLACKTSDQKLWKGTSKRSHTIPSIDFGHRHFSKWLISDHPLTSLRWISTCKIECKAQDTDTIFLHSDRWHSSEEGSRETRKEKTATEDSAHLLVSVLEVKVWIPNQHHFYSSTSICECRLHYAWWDELGSIYDLCSFCHCIDAIGCITGA